MNMCCGKENKTSRMFVITASKGLREPWIKHHTYD